MESQKIDNTLNLALALTPEERQKSTDLNVGYNKAERSWEVIVKFSGSPDFLSPLGITATELSGGFAILNVPQSLIPSLSEYPEIEFIEQPKRLFFQTFLGNTVSCIPPVQAAPASLTGAGVLIAVIDSGIRYDLSDFRNPDGTTRIRYLWDQTADRNPPDGYLIGTEYDASMINAALRENEGMRQSMVPSFDSSGHGTAVAGIAAGSPYGVAPGAGLLVVKLRNAAADGFPRTTELMQALDYVVKKARTLGMPVAVNLSFGNTYGAHDGSSLPERFISSLSSVWKIVICVGTGNEASAAGHVYGRLTPENESIVELAIPASQSSLNLQIWKAYPDIFDISLISPSGDRIGPLPDTLGTSRFRSGQTDLLVYYGKPGPFSIDQEIFIEFLPQKTYLSAGIWQIVFAPREIKNGSYALWLPSENLLGEETGFLNPTVTGTNTIPSTAQGVIAVGAYDPLTLRYASFSGRGQPGLGIRIRPDLVAPGINITAPSPDGLYREFTGTSFAVPFVTGSAALLMEWGIVRGNDPYLYGEKIRAFLQRGAKSLPGYPQTPNPETGWGALCLEKSLPNPLLQTE